MSGMPFRHLTLSMVLKMDLAISRIAVLLTENTKNILENDKIIILTFVCDKTHKIKNTNLRQNMDRKQIENSINQKKAEAIKEAKKNRLVFIIVSGILLGLGSALAGFGVDFLIHADKITGGIILAVGVALIVTVTVLMVFTDKKIKTLLSNLSKIGTEEITEEDIKEAEEEELEEAIFASTIDTESNDVDENIVAVEDEAQGEE